MSLLGQFDIFAFCLPFIAIRIILLLRWLATHRVIDAPFSRVASEVVQK
jgi:hypothetical protein